MGKKLLYNSSRRRRNKNLPQPWLKTAQAYTVGLNVSYDATALTLYYDLLSNLSIISADDRTTYLMELYDERISTDHRTTGTGGDQS